MGKPRRPDIRILMLGAPGVGKRCLESRFTTWTYPPPYDSALVLSGRRLLSLTESSPASPTASSASSLAPSSQPNLSVPGSPCLSPLSSPASAHLAFPTRPLPGARSSSCPSPRAESFMVEVINDSDLQAEERRRRVYSRREFDAVLLVYDIENRESFEEALRLHDEVRRHVMVKGRDKSSDRRRSWMGGRQSGRSSPSPEKEAGAGVVIALVGNKSDSDSDSDSAGSAPPTPSSPREEDRLPGWTCAPTLLGPAPPEGADPDTKTAIANPQLLLPDSGPGPDTKAAEAADEGMDPSRTAQRRQVTASEGRQAAQQLGLAVPFFETSARTGDQVEDLFGQVARAVLIELGWWQRRQSPRAEKPWASWGKRGLRSADSPRPWSMGLRQGAGVTSA